jgi:hypothetical protein
MNYPRDRRRRNGDAERRVNELGVHITNIVAELENRVEDACKFRDQLVAAVQAAGFEVLVEELPCGEFTVTVTGAESEKAA